MTDKKPTEKQLALHTEARMILEVALAEVKNDPFGGAAYARLGEILALLTGSEPERGYYRAALDEWEYEQDGWSK